VSKERTAHRERVFQKRAKVAHRPELDGKSQPIVIAAFLCYQNQIGIIEVKISSEVMG
jgi:hypothetical protein